MHGTKRSSMARRKKAMVKEREKGSTQGRKSDGQGERWTFGKRETHDILQQKGKIENVMARERKRFIDLQWMGLKSSN